MFKVIKNYMSYAINRKLFISINNSLIFHNITSGNFFYTVVKFASQLFIKNIEFSTGEKRLNVMKFCEIVKKIILR